MSDQQQITLREAALLAGITPQPVDKDTPDAERPGNQPGVEAHAMLETMLAASRRGKSIR